MSLLTPGKVRLPVPIGEIEKFSRRWSIREFALFGSVLRDDFSEGSDVDVLVTLAPNASRSLAEWLTMQEELERLFGRAVDLVERRSVERSVNWYRRSKILASAEVVYAA